MERSLSTFIISLEETVRAMRICKEGCEVFCELEGVLRIVEVFVVVVGLMTSWRMMNMIARREIEMNIGQMEVRNLLRIDFMVGGVFIKSVGTGKGSILPKMTENERET